MTAVSPDRRILKAFYTQYVAVLLIVLVFVVSGFQPSDGREDVSLKQPHDLGRPIGAMHLHTPRTISDEVPEALAAELRALVVLMKSHDIRVTFRVPVARLSDDTEDKGFQEALTYAKQLRSYMIKNGVPADAVRTVLSEESNGMTASLIFSSMEERNES